MVRLLLVNSPLLSSGSDGVIDFDDNLKGIYALIYISPVAERANIYLPL